MIRFLRWLYAEWHWRLALDRMYTDENSVPVSLVYCPVTHEQCDRMDTCQGAVCDRYRELHKC